MNRDYAVPELGSEFENKRWILHHENGNNSDINNNRQNSGLRLQDYENARNNQQCELDSHVPNPKREKVQFLGLKNKLDSKRKSDDNSNFDLSQIIDNILAQGDDSFRREMEEMIEKKIDHNKKEALLATLGDALEAMDVQKVLEITKNRTRLAEYTAEQTKAVNREAKQMERKQALKQKLMDKCKKSRDTMKFDTSFASSTEMFELATQSNNSFDEMSYLGNKKEYVLKNSIQQ